MSRAALADLVRDPAALIVMKATLILFLAALAGTVARGLSGARRHLLRRVALSSCVWVALSSPIVPTILVRTPVLTSEIVDVSAAAAAQSAHTARPSSSGYPATPFSVVEGARPLSSSIRMPGHPLVLLWVVASLALLLRQLRGFVGASRLAHRAAITASSEVGRAIRLGYSTCVQTPITFGIVNPCILLPMEAHRWPTDRRRAVLLHELAHVERGDWLAQMIGQVACALFWFHPLAWLAFARLRADAERAADDYVLRAGVSAIDYASHLLDLARPASAEGRMPIGVGIVSRTGLESRFLAMFDAKRSRANVTHRARAVTAGVALALVGPFASLRVAPIRQVRRVSPRGVAKPDSFAAAPIQRDTRSTAIVERPARDTARRSSEVGEPVVPQPATVRPDFSGTWRVETPAADSDSFINDSLTIRQSADSLSLESRGHGEGVRTSNSVHNVTFDGAWSRGMAITGDRGVSFTTRASWVADTLVLTTYAVGTAGAGIHDNLNIERLTLSADGNTLIDTQLSIPDGRTPRDGPRVFVLRRIAR